MALDVGSCAAGDGEGAVSTIIVVGTFDGNVAVLEEDSPEALPFGFAGSDGAGTLTVVVANDLGVGCVIDGVVEAENVAEGFVGWMPFLYGVGDGVFDDVNGKGVARVSGRAVMQGSREKCARKQTNKQGERGTEDEHFFHGHFPLETVRCGGKREGWTGHAEV